MWRVLTKPSHLQVYIGFNKYPLWWFMEIRSRGVRFYRINLLLSCGTFWIFCKIAECVTMSIQKSIKKTAQVIGVMPKIDCRLTCNQLNRHVDRICNHWSKMHSYFCHNVFICVWVIFKVIGIWLCWFYLSMKPGGLYLFHSETA